MFSSALSLSFFAFLRVGEITSDSASHLGNHVIQISDVTFVTFQGNEELHLNVRSSKTDQIGFSTILIIREQKDKFVCPIRLLKAFLQIRDQHYKNNLYVHIDGSSLTRYQFSAILQKSLSFCAVSGHFRSHSFRIGGAS